MARKGEIDLSRRTAFPDSQAATSYILKYIGSTTFIEELEDDEDTMSSITTLKSLIENEDFYIKLNMVTGERQRDKDEKLLERLQSRSKNTRATAILDFLYSIRCNMFHGQKGFNEIQTNLLKPSLTILRKVTELLFNKLEND